MHDSLSAEAFAHVVNTEGGASHNIKTAKPAEGPGVMVSVPGAEKVTNAPITSKQVKDFRNEHATAAANDEYHGAWKSGDKVFQDISKKETTLDAARKSGSAGKQIAGYDLGGTDARRPQGGEIFFDRSVKGHETDPEWKSTSEATSIPERMSSKPKAQEFAEQAHVSRSAANKGKKISINEVYATIAKNRRNRGV
jgi:hypothetical protein